MALDAEDNIYCVGSFDGTLYVYDVPGFPSLYTASQSGPFLLKIGSSGEMAWNTCIADNDDYVSPGNLKVDRNGDIYLTGIFRHNASFKKNDPGFSISNAGDIDFFVCKLDNKGEVKWIRPYGGTSSDHSMDLCIDDQSNVYITGEASSPECFKHLTGESSRKSTGEAMFVLKLDGNGNFQWVMAAGGDNQNWVHAACWDKLAGLVVGGFCSSSQIEFGGHKLKTTGSADGFIFAITDTPPLKK
jgi:hypothetical protein